MVQLNRVSAGAGARVGLFFVAFAWKRNIICEKK
jgi:hypothetical protein